MLIKSSFQENEHDTGDKEHPVLVPILKGMPPVQDFSTLTLLTFWDG